MQNAQQQHHAQQAGSQEGLEMNLRETLLRESGTSSGPAPYPPPPAPTVGSSHPYPPQDHTGSPQNHHHHQQIDPNVSGPYAMSTDHQMDDGSDRKGKRELSTSKRAAQNRAAQRAFRQRKEGYIKKLEEQVKDFQTMEHNFKALQNENYQLREYILSLQSRLLENQAEFPPAPAQAHLQTTAPSQQDTTPPESSYAAEQQLRRELEPRAPPPAPVVAREDPAERLSQLTQAAVAQEAQQHQSSPYGIAGEYPSTRPDASRPESSVDAKPAE